MMIRLVPFNVFELRFEDEDLLFEVCKEMRFLLHERAETKLAI